MITQRKRYVGGGHYMSDIIFDKLYPPQDIRPPELPPAASSENPDEAKPIKPE